jgi:mRNA-degrading endonuclease RelE of RelBE toxin-antitoxin system
MGLPEFELIVAAPARRALDRIPAKVAIAVLDFMLGPLIENPERVGKPLRGDLAGLFSARVGGYRVVYEIDRSAGRMLVVMIDHRADIYRPR